MKSIMLSAVIVLAACVSQPHEQRQWLAGDHHIHSYYSVGWDQSSPPKPIVGGDATYSIEKNAEMAKKFGLQWMVATDHGGPNHAKINLQQAYPELLQARDAHPTVIQFFGLELNTPGADHSSIIIPKTDQEAAHLHSFESQFDSRQVWPLDATRNTEPLMLDALQYVENWPEKPVVIAHHPSRSASGLGSYGHTEPAELRRWNNTAPEIAVGMEGAPGHQAAQLRQGEPGNASIIPAWVYARGAYGRGYPTMGGFDQMTAQLGGFWDSMLGEGRRWWITANSDSHVHYTEGGIDFWPGEYSKTYVYAVKDHADVLDGIRRGRIFVTTGDLISELYLDAEFDGKSAAIGEGLKVPKDAEVTINIRLKDPAALNPSGNNPSVERVDLIVGEVSGPTDNLDLNQNPTTRVVLRFTEWQRDGEYLTMSHRLPLKTASYVRVRGTNNVDELEPAADEHGEDPWSDLWFYSNPVFVSIE